MNTLKAYLAQQNTSNIFLWKITYYTYGNGTGGGFQSITYVLVGKYFLWEIKQNWLTSYVNLQVKI
jgi:hypothetical protein